MAHHLLNKHYDLTVDPTLQTEYQHKQKNNFRITKEQVKI